MNSQKPPFVITMGDPNGIGPETIVKAYAKGHLNDCCVVGDVGRLQEAVKICGLAVSVEAVNSPTTSADKLTVIQSGQSFLQSEFGIVSAEAGAASFAYLEQAIELTKSNQAAGMITVPIHKEAWSAAGITHPGHTEVLAEHAGDVEVAMMLGNDELRVVLVTIHVSVRQACDMITVERELRTIKLAHQACLQFGIDNPRIAVAGLNPHAGEGGLFGSEEIEIISPAIDQAKADKLNVSGPYAGDTVFARARKGEFDIVVAQYHDQGLIPVKYMGIADGVNVTVGLPFVRTSPDHGTAFDIAGTGVADEGSLVTAIKYAQKLSRKLTT